MSLFSIAFLFVGSVCFTLGFLHLLIFMQRKDLKEDLAFSVMAVSIALSSFLEIWAFRTGDLPNYISLLKWTLSVQCILWASFAWFIHYYTKAVKVWPSILITILYSIAFLINLTSQGSILFSDINELTPFALSQYETIYYANGAANPWRVIADSAWIFLLIYAGAASFMYGKDNNRGKAYLFGSTIFLCLGLGYLHGTLIDVGIADPPYLGSFLFLPLSLIMSHSLARDVVKSSKLSEEVHAAEKRWRHLLENVQLIVLGVDHEKNIFYVNPYFCKLTGYAESDVIDQPFLKVIPEEYHNEMDSRITKVYNESMEILPHRYLPLIIKTGERREIHWSNVFITQNSVNKKILSIGRDITDQQKAEKSRDLALQELESLKSKLETENISLKEIIVSEHGFDEIIGKSNELLYVLGRVQQIALTDSTVLIQGETGTGKELVARAIHKQSDRKSQPFIRVNCAAIPGDIVESELFGHEEGSFTNALKLHRGKFELASGGIIFLDEISEMPLPVQAKLLTVLQEREIERVGGSESIPIDVHVIAATNRDLIEEVNIGNFRADLYYRLNVYPITVPTLRDRKSDIPLLIKHFIAMFNKKFNKEVIEIPPHVMNMLEDYRWPGNVRELRNVIERAIITSSSESLSLTNELSRGEIDEDLKSNLSSTEPDVEILPLAEMERNHIQKALLAVNWQINGPDGAAELLKMNPSTLRSRIKKHQITKPK